MSLGSQVSVAVLLDNFVTASTVMENAQRDRKQQERKALTQFQNPLQPLILRLANRSVFLWLRSTDDWLHIYISTPVR